jgi:hypothetical protein
VVGANVKEAVEAAVMILQPVVLHPVTKHVAALATAASVASVVVGEILLMAETRLQMLALLGTSHVRSEVKEVGRRVRLLLMVRMAKLCLLLYHGRVRRVMVSTVLVRLVKGSRSSEMRRGDVGEMEKYKSVTFERIHWFHGRFWGSGLICKFYSG